ncbi:glycosyltransferase family protein [Saccharicrinis carchari]|nr:sugar transferase [Saccharicrinis carchari]
MKTVPILLFTYNRPQHTRLTVEALLKNPLANQSHLYVFSDEAKSPADREAVDTVRAYLNQIKGFASVSKVFHKQNKGLAKSIIEGVSEVFQIHDKAIVLEDDLETSPHFLQFMNAALNYYSPQKVWSIAGYTPNIKIPDNYVYDSYLVHRNCSWGWATWKQNWMKVDWEVKDFKTFFTDKNQRYQFERGGNDLSVMLLKQQKQIIDSWSVRFNYAAYKNNKPSVYPTQSFINNRGVDGSGTNMKRSGKYDSALFKGISADFKFCSDDVVHPAIAHHFKQFYNVSLYRRLINGCKTQMAVWDYKKGNNY